LSRLYHSPISDTEKVIIGEYRTDIESDKAAEKRLASVFVDINVITTIEGKKLVPIQELLKVERQMQNEKEESAQKGYKEGYEKGLSDGHKDAQKVIDNFASLINDAVKQRQVLFDEAHQKILEMVLQIAKNITFDAARIDPDITAGIIAGAISKLVDRSKIKVKVHPDQLPLMEQQIDRFKGDSTAIKEIVIEPDNRVRYGGCFIETPKGDIDARVESQMEAIAEAISAGGDES
jgi:flagellar biosynthesis/type III secretory pathway protein FliH